MALGFGDAKDDLSLHVSRATKAARVLASLAKELDEMTTNLQVGSALEKAKSCAKFAQRAVDELEQVRWHYEKGE